MKDFYEAILTLETEPRMAEVYKKAIEEENSRYWTNNEVKNAKGEIVKEENKPIWNGNHCHVGIIQHGQTVEISKRGIMQTQTIEQPKAILTISMISHTLSNLKSMADWYEKMGAEVVYKSWESEK